MAVSPDDGSAIDLRNPTVAAVLAWLVPGAGHLYQRRWFKGWLFFCVIMGLFTGGFWIGQGRVVYWLWKPAEKRWALACQAGIGVAAIPAMIQAIRLEGAAKRPLAGGFMAPPVVPQQLVDRDYARTMIRRDPEISADDFRDQPRGGLQQFQGDELSIWHRRLGRWFEIGTLYTMIAGLLNLLVIYDALAGPLGVPTEEDRRKSRGGKEAS